MKFGSICQRGAPHPSGGFQGQAHGIGWIIVLAFIVGLAVFVFAATAQPAQAGSLYWQVIEFLVSKGVTPGEDDFSIQDNSDGQGPFVARWNEATLGPEPTLSELQTFLGNEPPPPDLIDLPVADGGTGASNYPTARTNLGLGTGDSPSFMGLVTKTITAPSGGLEVKGVGGASVGGFAAGGLQVRGTGTTENSNAVITGHSSFSGNTQLWYLGNTSSSNKDVAFINRQGGSLFFSTNNTERLRITSGGGIGIGTSGVSASAIVELSSTTKALLVTRMTTAQRDALTAVNGMIIYNTTTNTMQGRVNGAWADM